VVLSVEQNGGVGLFGTKVSGAARTGRSLSDAAGDARFDPLYGTTKVGPLDLRGLKVSSSGPKIDVTLLVRSLEDPQSALTTTGAGALDWVVRWSGPPVDDPETGARNPIYYVAVEVGLDGTPTFFAGEALSVELCSVSGCFPHIVDYPAPPRGGTAVTGELNLTKGADAWVIHVPRSLVGIPNSGATLESLSAYTFARLKSASLPFTNAEAEADISPIEVDGLCCRDAKILS
jgi:hypothetical protein